MNICLTFILVSILSFVRSRDFYVGMFKKNDWLVAQDRLYKERVPYKYMYAKYGRIFKCKITYFRVSDRLGFGPGPKVQIVRGGLSHKYLVLRLTSPYNMPISVNIYVGCANTFTTAKAETHANEINNSDNTTKDTGDQNQNGVTATEAQLPGDVKTTGANGTGEATTIAATTT